MRDYKVVIPSAGIGSRLGSITKNFNKALVTIGEKPSICHIIVLSYTPRCNVYFFSICVCQLICAILLDNLFYTPKL